MTKAHVTRIAVLASGSGSNLQALIDHLEALGDLRRGELALALSNRADAGALARARTHGVAAAVLADPADDAAMDALLHEHGIELVVLAGYLKLVPPAVTRRFRGRMLNVHPALLPAFGGPRMYGRRVHEAVIASGARLSGPTVHFVDEQYDRGPIVAQWPVPVFDEDTPETLAARVLRVEHVLYPRIIDAVAGDAIALDDDDRVRGAFLVGSQGEAFALPREMNLEEVIDAAIAR